MRWMSGLLVGACLLMAAACGGSSDEDDDGGSGGTSSGSGGSTSGSGGTSGGNTGGTSSGTGGTSSGTGGTSSGTGGAGGFPIPMNPPDPELLESCLDVCERGEALECPNEATTCRQQCDIWARFTDCSQEAEAVFACGETAELTCGEDGEPEVNGCETELQAMALCALGGTPDPEWDAQCGEFCEAQADAACENGEDAASCAEGCSFIPTVFPNCSTQYAALMSCAVESGFMCDSEGEPVPNGCEQESVAFLTCTTGSEQP